MQPSERFDELLARAKRGEQAALDELLPPAIDLVWRILTRFRTLSEALREDITQDVFVTLLERGLQRFKGDTEHEWRAYLKRMSVNAAISKMRHMKFEVPSDIWMDEPGTDNPETETAQDEAVSQLMECASALEATDQQIFWMRMREFSYAEIVSALKVPQGTVASKFHRAQQKIVDCMRAAGLSSMLDVGAVA